MKKGVKVLIILLVMIIIGLVTYLVLDKTILSKDNKKEDSKGSSVVTNEEKNVGEIIMAEINKKEFLVKNGIEEDDVDILEYCVIETQKSPIYIVLVDYVAEGEAEHGNIFQVIYKDEKVVFDKIEDHKYLSDTIAYDSNKEILKLSATYHGGTRTNYFALKDGKFEEVDLAIVDGSKEYNFKELETTKLGTTKKSNNEKQKSNESYTLNGTYERADASRRTTGTMKITNYNGEAFEFSIEASHVNGQDIDAAIERGAVSIGGVEGIAFKIRDGVYEFVPDDDDDIWSYWEGDYKITFTVNSKDSISLKETYNNTKYSEGPYGGHNLWFDGTYTK